MVQQFRLAWGWNAAALLRRRKAMMLLEGDGHLGVLSSFRGGVYWCG